MKPWLKTTVILATTILTAWLIRTLAFLPILITTDERPSLMAGDRVLVARFAFGLRLPLDALFGYHRLSPTLPRQGEPIVFNDPLGKRRNISDRPLCVGTCTALPGDTIWLPWGSDGTCRKAAKHYPFVVPGKGITIDIHPWNIVMLANALHLYEQKNVCWDCDSLLVIDGQQVRNVSFADDYIWVSSNGHTEAYDSRLFGPLPVSHLEGKPMLILYSKDSSKPFYNGYRYRRFLSVLP